MPFLDPTGPKRLVKTLGLGLEWVETGINGKIWTNYALGLVSTSNYLILLSVCEPNTPGCAAQTARSLRINDLRDRGGHSHIVMCARDLTPLKALYARKSLISGGLPSWPRRVPPSSPAFCLIGEIPAQAETPVPETGSGKSRPTCTQKFCEFEQNINIVKP